MSKLIKIWTNKSPQGDYELCLDWDNNYHHAISLNTLKPDDVKSAFLAAAREINQSEASGAL